MSPRSLRALARALFAGFLTACSGGGNGAAALQPSRLVIAQPQEPQSLNPLFLTGSNTATIGPLLYSYLLTLDDQGRLQPDVAVAVPSVANGGISLDGLSITYHLRPGVRWQDGAPLSARDVAFTYTAIVTTAGGTAKDSKAQTFDIKYPTRP